MKGTTIFDLEGTLVDVAGEAVSQVFICEDLLKDLAQQYELAIVTGATRTELNYVLENTILGKYFKPSKTITRSDCKEAKSTGLPFRMLLESGVSLPAVVVGDGEGDCLGSEANGVSFVKVDTSQLLSNPQVMREYISVAVAELEKAEDF